MQCRRSYQPCFIGKRVQPSNGMEQKRHRSDKPSASINEERAKMIDLMEYQDKKQRKKSRIECEDQLIQDVQKRKSSRNEEVLRKAIPGLEKKQFSWMRSIINAGGIIA